MTITFAGRIASSGLTGYGQETGNAAGLTLVADPAGAPGNVLRAYMAQGDAVAGGSYRSEISTYNIKAAIGAVSWYWFETYIPADWVDGGNWATIWQIHDTADGGDVGGRHPPIECIIDGSQLVLSSAAATADADDTSVERHGIWRMTTPKGRWVSWVLKADWRYTTAGALTLWRDQRLVYQETGKRNCYNDVVGLFPKFGIYVPNNLNVAIPNRTVFHRGMVTGDSAYSSFNAFMAAAGTSQIELEAVMFRGSAV